jgi:hypothetical protein
VIHVCDVHDPLVRGGEPRGPGAAARDAAVESDWELFLRLVFNARPGADPNSSDVILHDGTQISYYDLQSRPPGKSADEHLAHLRRLFQAYLYTCERFDAQRFKRLIDGLRAAGAWQQTALALLADHGESQYWANPWRLAHGPLADETVTRVPLMLKLPGAAPRRIEHLTGLVDVAPTLLEVAQIQYDAESLDGRSLLPTVQHDRPAADEYWIEGWSHELGDDDPHVICRAIRRADGRKYVWNGAAIDWAGLDAMSESRFVEYAARCSFGNPPSTWLRARIEKLRREHDAVNTLRTLLAGGRPRHVIFDDVDADLTERAGIVVAEGHTRWAEYERYRLKMSALTAEPNAIAAQQPSADVEALTAHLQALGYV